MGDEYHKNYNELITSEQEIKRDVGYRFTMQS